MKGQKGLGFQLDMWMQFFFCNAAVAHLTEELTFAH